MDKIKFIESSEKSPENFDKDIKIISANYPLLNTLRFKKGDIITSILFSNLKEVNRKYSKQEADIAIEVIKNIYKNFFKKKEGNNNKNRVIKNPYKGITFGLKSENLDDYIHNLKKILNYEYITNNEIKSLQYLKIDIFELFFKSTFSEKNIKKITKDNIEKYVGEYFEEIGESGDVEKTDLERIKKIIDELGFKEEIKENKDEDFKKKILFFYETEFSSTLKSSNFLDVIKDNKVLIKKIENKENSLLKKARFIARKIKKIEKEIKAINPELSYSKNPESFFDVLEKVKNGNFVGNENVAELFKNYKEVISAFDIIITTVGEIDFKKLEEKYKGIDETVREHKKILEEKSELSEEKQKEVSEKIKELKEKTYKGSLTREALAKKIDGQKGTLMFIDIAGMGMSNIKENRLIVEDILNSKISKEEKEKKLLSAGLNMTNSLIEIVEKLKNLGAEISLGGDELFMFIPEEKEEQLSKNIITDIFEESNIKARSTYFKVKDGINQDEVFKYYDKLDDISSKNKEFEKLKKEKRKTINIFGFEQNLKNKDKEAINFYEIDLEELDKLKEDIGNKIVSIVGDKSSYLFNENLNKKERYNLEIEKYLVFEKYILELRKITKNVKRFSEKSYSERIVKLTEDIYKLKVNFNSKIYTNFTIENLDKTEKYLKINGYFN